MNTLGMPIPDTDAMRQQKEDYLELLRTHEQRREHIRQGGGATALERQHKRGKLSARERVAALVDPGSFFELGLWAGEGLYPHHGAVPAAGTVMGLGRIQGRLAMILANDPTVKAGAWFPITVKKNLRAQEICLENGLPIVYLVDSAGVFLPLQDEIFPDREHFGRIFRNNAVMSSRGIPQVAAIMGSCVAGGAYLPIMSDEALIVEGTGSVFLAGSHLVKAAIGEVIDNEKLGGATVHCSISGVTDYKAANDSDCLNRIREIFGQWPAVPAGPFARAEPAEPAFPPDDLLALLLRDHSRPYDMREILARLVDDSQWLEYKPDYGRTLLCGTARVCGWTVGIVANQRLVVKSGRGELQVGGVIYSDSADKATRFILNCNQRRIPLVFLQDVTGFMVGSQAEHGGIIKDGAKLVNAVANSTVPKFTFILGNSFGAGNYAMCGKAYDPRFIYAVPSARIAVMGGAQASQVLLDIRLGQAAHRGKELSEAEKQAALAEIHEKYVREMDPVHGAARLWVDEILDPRLIRRAIDLGLEAASHNPHIPRFNPGVIQT
ncbi:MAG: carboxyl transferase domain-containing protein [bacterium]|nr:carboxyl transferase domain-containing protein [bacterium]